jgi:hypothetical protein
MAAAVDLMILVGKCMGRVQGGDINYPIWSGAWGVGEAPASPVVPQKVIKQTLPPSLERPAGRDASRSDNDRHEDRVFHYR